MIPRLVNPLLDELLVGYPVVTIIGPRQSGKTTVTNDLFKGLRKWLAVAGDAARQPRLVCAVPTSYQRDGIQVRRWQEAASA